jgi:ubiquitin carboxyl-terminal hydrolase 5/13
MERAVEWLFSHMDTPMDDDEEAAPGAASGGQSQAIVGDVTKKGNYQLASFISHKGPSVHCGHYVSHIKKGHQWVLFNDNKVVDDPKAPVDNAYIYIFKRED